jgi:hypothetical protein
MRSRGTGGCDFEAGLGACEAKAIRWTAQSHPATVPVTEARAGLADPEFRLPSETLQALCVSANGEHVVTLHGEAFRFFIDALPGQGPAVLLPLDRLFDIRAHAAVRFWRSLIGRNPGPNPANLSRARRDRLVLALRALDGRLNQASYREIARTLFAGSDLTSRAWTTHDLRDRTIRLVRYGSGLMDGGYRRLLHHPYRRRS